MKEPSSVQFKIDEFKKALLDGQEVNVYDTLVTSNLQKNNTIKVPVEAFFVDWHDA